MDELRVRLIERLCQLPEKHLPAVDALFETFERDGAHGLVLPPAPNSVLSPPHKDWPHAPLHRLSEHGTFIVTASTAHKEHLFRGAERLTMLEDQFCASPNNTTLFWRRGRCSRTITTSWPTPRAPTTS